MEDMDIDMAVEVPDTPDRIAAWHSNGRQCVGPESNSSLAGNSRNSGVMDEECLNQLRVTGRLVSENGHRRRLCGRPQKNFSNINETARRSSSINLSSPDNLYPSLNGDSMRRTSIDEKSKHQGGSSFGGRVDKGKAVRNVFPCKPLGCQEENDILASAVQNEHSRLLEMAFPPGASKDLQANGGSTLHRVSNSSKASETACKGKEKSNDKIRKDPTFHSVIFPNVTGRKRLVRNGCISPHNIALRAKELAEREGSSSKEIECDNTANVVSNVSPSVIDISDIIAEDNTYVRVKGKGVMVHPFSSKEHDARKHKMPSSPVIINEENSGASNASRDAFGCFEGLDGWGSTRNRSKSTHLPLSDAAGCLSGRNEDVGCSINQHPENRVEERDNESGRNSKAECDYPEDWNVAQTASRIVSEPDLMCRPSHAANSHIRRQKKRVLTSRNRGESSTLFSDNSEIVFLGSSGESSNSRSARIQNGQHQDIWNPVIDIDALSPEMRLNESPNLGCMNIDDSDSRARQVEADEMLARELQEQLYHEVPMVGDGEIDEHIALTLQHEEDAIHLTSNGNPRTSHPSGPSIAHLYRQPQSRLVQNASNRRRTQGQVPTSARMAPLRSHLSSPSPIIPLRERNFQFPSDMDLDMRLDILEALEDTVGDLSNLRMANHILQVHRDFNENDYEMLLALDEDNHQHIGASVNQINRLPQSTVQTENFEEACAICLELPTTGETIRHLPCLHKFHKDCIDPWLRRKTSCPVCKSSIT